jgi:hypothetical protein
MGYFSHEARKARRELREKLRYLRYGTDEPGALRIPAADGYHYTDDHRWSDEDQADLERTLWSIAKKFGGSVPEEYADLPEDYIPPKKDETE